MFGYVKASIPDLRVKEYELYRAGYCGVCRAMGRCTGCLSRMTLTWDSVFLFFLRTALTGDKFELDKKRCLAHPTHRRTYVCASPQLDYCARATAVMTYYKLKDDISDESGVRRAAARLAMLEASPAKKRADIEELCLSCGTYLPQLAEIEKRNAPSFDEPAHVSALLTADLFACGLEKGSRAEIIARDIGYHTGKFIYAADAADDLSADVKRGRYNPYAAMLNKSELDENDKKMIYDALRCETGMILRGLDLIDFDGNDGIKAILYNIVGTGMICRAEEILNGKKQKEANVHDRSI